MSDRFTDDLLLGGRIRLRQPARGFRVAIDSILLAASVPAVAGERVLDLGCGTGGAALALLARCPGTSVVGLETQADFAALARDNAALNAMSDRLTVLHGTVENPPAGLGAGFDRAMANPPYFDPRATDASPEPSRATASVEGADGLAPWIALAARSLKAGGTLTMIHDAARCEEIVALLTGWSTIVLPLIPKAGRSAKRVLIEARRPGSGVTRRPPLVLHAADGSYRVEIEAVLRHAAPLVLAAASG
ncbi:MAG: methyltransferase [Alphaproteobacteria bacterium]|nr:methyltransferase [Alphaproteobacteria bacterium]